MYETQRYSVIILFNNDGSKILLQKKDRTAFAGKLNGVGGKIDDNEIPTNGALREILEETSIRSEDLKHFKWCGTLLVPEQCDERIPNKYPELWFFAGIVKDESLAQKPETETEEIDWYVLNSDNKPVTDLETAGDGDLEYFINVGKRLLFDQNVVSYA